MARKPDKMPARNKKNFRPTKSGAGMTAKVWLLTGELTLVAS